MSAPTPTVERLEPADHERVEALLAATDLPTVGVRDGSATYYGIVEDGSPVAVGGLEPYDSVGLLRSVAVEEARRGRGLGTRICEAIEERARERGIQSLYLLTTTASDFFRARGYTERHRSEAPPAIRETSEFEEVCPASAVLMGKALD